MRQDALGQGDRARRIAHRLIRAVSQQADQLPVADRFLGPAAREVLHDGLGLHELARGLGGATGQVEQFSQSVMRECFTMRECGCDGCVGRLPGRKRLAALLLRLLHTPHHGQQLSQIVVGRAQLVVQPDGMRKVGAQRGHWFDCQAKVLFGCCELAHVEIQLTQVVFPGC